MNIFKSVLLFFMMTTFANADGFKLDYAPTAKHFLDSDCCINEQINMLAVSYDNVGVFGYKNSFGEFSYGISHETDLKTNGRITFSVVTGVVFGYRDKYYINRSTNELIHEGKKVVYPILSPTVTMRVSDNVGVGFTQLGAASVLTLRFNK